MKSYHERTTALIDIILRQMNGSQHEDMLPIQIRTEAYMTANDLSFVSYEELREEIEEDYLCLLQYHEETADYFFHAINRVGLNKATVRHYIDLCVQSATSHYLAA